MKMVRLVRQNLSSMDGSKKANKILYGSIYTSPHSYWGNFL